MNPGDLTPQFNNAVAAEAGTKQPAQSQPVTRQQAEALMGQLSEPRLVLEHTPVGAVTVQVRTENDHRIMAEVEDIHKRLAERRNCARDEFNMAHDGPEGTHLRPRMKM